MPDSAFPLRTADFRRISQASTDSRQLHATWISIQVAPCRGQMPERLDWIFSKMRSMNGRKAGGWQNILKPPLIGSIGVAGDDYL